MNKIIKSESSIELFGYQGRAYNVIADDVTGRIANQTIKLQKIVGKERITVTLRFDDNCNNGHESFAITGQLDENSGGYWHDSMGGCIHDEIAKHFPRLAHLIKWHLTSTDGPMHYKENTLYWLGYSGYCDGSHNSPPNIENARSTAVWPDMPESYICHPDVRLIKATREAAKAQLATVLMARLPALLADFQSAMLSCGFEWPVTQHAIAV